MGHFEYESHFESEILGKNTTGEKVHLKRNPKATAITNSP